MPLLPCRAAGRPRGDGAARAAVHLLEQGGVSGTLSRIAHGAVEPVPQNAIIETQENNDEGTCEGPPPQWVQIHYDDAAGVVTATAVPRPPVAPAGDHDRAAAG